MDLMMLGRDPSVVIIGQDVGYFGGVFRATDGLQRKYGEHRVIDAPIAEGGIVGSAIGMGVNGLRPGRPKFSSPTTSIPASTRSSRELAKLRYRTAGRFLCTRSPSARPAAAASAAARPIPRARKACSPTCLRPEGDHAVKSLRCQRSADQRHRRRRSGGVLRTEAHLQRTLRRRPGQAGSALEQPSRKARFRKTTTRCPSVALSGTASPASRRDRALLRHHGARLRSGGRQPC